MDDVRSHPRPIVQREIFDELVKSNLSASKEEEEEEGSLENAIEKRSLFDAGIATKVTVSAKMKTGKTKIAAVRNISGGSSFRNESGTPAPRSTLHGGESTRLAAEALALVDESLPDEPSLRDKLRELELEFPPLK
jgi:hypothetical protein